MSEKLTTEEREALEREWAAVWQGGRQNTNDEIGSLWWEKMAEFIRLAVAAVPGLAPSAAPAGEVENRQYTCAAHANEVKRGGRCVWCQLHDTRWVADRWEALVRTLNLEAGAETAERDALIAESARLRVPAPAGEREARLLNEIDYVCRVLERIQSSVPIEDGSWYAGVAMGVRARTGAAREGAEP